MAILEASELIRFLLLHVTETKSIQLGLFLPLSCSDVGCRCILCNITVNVGKWKYCIQQTVSLSSWLLSFDFFSWKMMPSCPKNVRECPRLILPMEIVTAHVKRNDNDAKGEDAKWRQKELWTGQWSDVVHHPVKRIIRDPISLFLFNPF